jgi:hypothetical protein
VSAAAPAALPLATVAVPACGSRSSLPSAAPPQFA